MTKTVYIPVFDLQTFVRLTDLSSGNVLTADLEASQYALASIGLLASILN